MAIAHQHFDGIGFTDARGVYRVIYSAPLKQRRELAHCLTVLGDRLKASPYKSISEAYDHDLEFPAIAHRALELGGIDPDWLNLDMLIEFCLPHRDSGGNPQKPLLEQINFPPVDENQTGGSYAEAVAAVWSHTKDIEQALKVAGYDINDPPAWADLQAILEAKNEIDQPEIKEKKEVAKEIEKALEDGSWFGNFTQAMAANSIASPQQTDQMMREILGG